MCSASGSVPLHDVRDVARAPCVYGMCPAQGARATACIQGTPSEEHAAPTHLTLQTHLLPCQSPELLHRSSLVAQVLFQLVPLHLLQLGLLFHQQLHLLLLAPVCLHLINQPAQPRLLIARLALLLNLWCNVKCGDVERGFKPALDCRTNDGKLVPRRPTTTQVDPYCSTSTVMLLSLEHLLQLVGLGPVFECASVSALCITGTCTNGSSRSIAWHARTEAQRTHTEPQGIVQG